MAISKCLDEYRFGGDSVRSFASHHDYTASRNKKIPKIRKAVRFGEKSTTTIASHRDYTLLEHRSAWYTEGEYCSFASKIHMEKMSAPSLERQERHKQSMRNDKIRHCVLQAHSNKSTLKRQRNKISDEKCKRLSDYYKYLSEACLIEARQRGIENDLELLDIKIREISMKQPRGLNSRLSSKSCFKKDNIKNARWSTRESNVPKDVAPTAIRRVRPALIKDVCSNKNISMR